MATFGIPDAVREQLKDMRVSIVSLKKESRATMEHMAVQLSELKQSFAVLSDLVVGELQRLEEERRRQSSETHVRIAAAEQALHAARKDLALLRHDCATGRARVPYALSAAPSAAALDTWTCGSPESRGRTDAAASAGHGGGGRDSDGGSSGAAAHAHALAWRLDDVEKALEAQARQLTALREQRLADLEHMQSALAAGVAQRSALRQDVLACGAAAAAAEAALEVRAARAEAAARDAAAATRAAAASRTAAYAAAAVVPPLSHARAAVVSAESTAACGC
ncbi:hypothetical protein JKP88DRAFT_276715 [Tribonema minus]|uniref:Uncharacterized protein n=1 Tax=Tribonema minus TaxID=303371 RepID=A0A836CH41_9STRA|nr:hypothetical protein JKP88DRAFT_276715 [Tribonema minus]